MITKAQYELLQSLVSRELKARYKGSVLGVLWSILTPLFMAIIYAFFFRMLIGRGVPTEGIIIGVFAWQFTVYCMNTGMMCITGNATLVKRVKFNRATLPGSIVGAGLVDYLLSLLVQLPLIFLLLHSQGLMISSNFLLLIPVLLLHLVFNSALVFTLSTANVYLRDTQHFVGVFVSAWFFVSPVMYDLEFVRQRAVGMEWIADVFMLNPLAIIMTGYRTALIPNTPFPWNGYAIAGLIFTGLFSLFAFLIFKKGEKNFADYV